MIRPSWAAAFLSFLFAVAPVFAQDTNEVVAGTRDFSGGLNEFVDKSKLAPNQSPTLINVLIDDQLGVIRPRRGFTQCGVTPSGNAATRLFEYARTNGTRRLIVSDNETVWETPDCVAFTEIVTGLADNVPDFALVRDDLWIVNRSTHVLVWNGTTLTTLDTRASTPDPAPPRCAYLEFWRERVWCARTSANPSDVAFSAITDPQGADITPSTGAVAWPATNVLAVDQDGGCPIFGIQAYRDALYVFKGDCGIFQIIFENDFNIAVLKTFASIGAKFHTGIVEGDGLLHFVGPDGFYITDMKENLQRISDAIPDTFESLRQPGAGSGLSVWTSQADFEAGIISSLTVTQIPGSLALSTETVLLANGDFETGDFTNWSATCTFTNAFLVVSAAPAPGLIEGSFSAINAHNVNGAVTCSANILDVSGSTLTALTISNTGVPAQPFTVETNDFRGQTASVNFFTSSSLGECSLTSDSFTLGTAVTFIAATDCPSSGDATARGFNALDTVQTHNFFSSGTFDSEIRDVGVVISSWSTFAVTQDLNGGTIVYMVRLGTNTGAVQQAAYVDIIPGAIIDATTSQTFIQWTATFTHSDPGPATINDVTFNFLTGDLTSAPIYVGFHKNRFWVSAASGSSTTNNIVLQKSRSPSVAIVPFDLQTNDFTHFNDNFYAAASTHSGIYILDVGTNDNGAAIEWSYTTPEFIFGHPYTEKTLKEIIFDFRNASAQNMKIGFKRNDTLDFTEVTRNISSVGRATDRLFINGGLSHGFQFRIRNATLDETADIIGINAFAIPGRTRQ